METRIESQMQSWKDYNKAHRIYMSCIYESSPSEGNLAPRLTVRIFLHRSSLEGEDRIGGISIFVDRDRWDCIANLNNAVEADDQLKKAAISAKEGNWEIEPLPRMLRKGCEVVQNKIDVYETDGSLISEGFSI